MKECSGRSAEPEPDQDGIFSVKNGEWRARVGGVLQAAVWDSYTPAWEAYTKTRAALAAEPEPAEPILSILAGNPRRIWPFVETPGEFAGRMEAAWRLFECDMLAAVRYTLIENPPALSEPEPVRAALAETAIEGGKPSAETERARFEHWSDLYNLSFKHWQFAVTSPMGEACWAAWQAALSSQQPQGGEK